ncbi:DUF2231 domain-containing protein [Pseudomonas sp. KSR10]|jgi:uncharacterized membrane protein|uniref:Membrane protein n=1 Tax=Stutzerimonas stutzeri TaxID=316 RepID=A0A0D9AP00_STUST|nr:MULTISPECIES: DUF2231 domain-containing protein [Pseudomonadaceae]KJH82713.1 membrane protein [Stutzerimonas stutzeri]MCG6542495.1 DUF2231 domain-containing protein [Pseudomonas sp. KSR10]
MAKSQYSIHSRAAIAGHPLHPMLIHFPVAALTGLLPVDLAHLWTLDDFWWRAGLWLAGVGALGGWVASIFGLIDLLTVREIRLKITAWCHAILAVMMLSLASLNWLLRFQNKGGGMELWALYLSAVTAALIALAAYLGGRLVYEHAVGVDVEKV